MYKPFFRLEGCKNKATIQKLIKKVDTREPGGTKSSELIRNLILKDYFNKI